jgi:hypothetical protein
MMYNCLAKGYTFSCLHFLLSLWVLDVYRFLMVALILNYLYQQFIPDLYMQFMIIQEMIQRSVTHCYILTSMILFFIFFFFCYVGLFIYYTNYFKYNRSTTTTTTVTKSKVACLMLVGDGVISNILTRFHLISSWSILRFSG